MDQNIYASERSMATELLSEAKKTSNPSNSGSTALTSSISTIDLHYDDGQHANEESSKEHGNLSLDGIRLFGRIEEVEYLNEAFDRVRQHDGPGTSEVIQIFGEGGSGKSTLVKQALGPDDAKEDDGVSWFVCGKFDQEESRNQPYSAITCALAELCDLVVQSDKLGRVRRALWREFGADTMMLSNLIPSLDLIVEGATVCSDTSELEDMGYAFTRFKLLVRQFLRTVSAAGRPICIFLDDLQWADDESMQLIETLVTDQLSSRLMFVLVHRDTEDIMRSMQRISMGKVGPALPWTMIPLANFSLESLNGMIAELLLSNTAMTLSLSVTVLKKTHGNPYFVMQFLERLKADGLLKWDGQIQSWLWNVDEINDRTDISDNVVDLVAGRIRRMRGHVQAVLKMAACFGHRFDYNLVAATLYAIYLKSSYREDEMDDDDSEPMVDQHWTKVARILDYAVHEGLIEETGRNQFKFTHDRVQEGLYSLIEDEEREYLHLWIGTVVQQKLDMEDADESLVLLAADHLNRAKSQLRDDTHRIERLIKLNFRAAEMALCKSAFGQSRTYLQAAIGLLHRERKWRENYKLAVTMYSMLAKVEYCMGLYDECRESAREVVQNATSLVDKMDVIFTTMNLLSAKHQHDEALDFGLGVLRQLGQLFPLKPCKPGVAADFVKTKKTIGKKTDNEIMRLPRCTDDKMIATMRLLSAVAALAHIRSQSCAMLFSHLVFRIVRLTLYYGLTNASAHGFACFGGIYSTLGDHENACRFGDMGLNLMRLLGARDMECRVGVILGSSITPFRDHLRRAAQQMTESYRVGLENGDIAMAGLTRMFAIYAEFYSGERLPIIMQECDMLIDQMSHYNAGTVVRLTRVYRGMVSKLVGVTSLENAEPAKLERIPVPHGKIITEENKVIENRLHHISECFLQMHFEDMENLESNVKILTRKYPVQPGNFLHFVSSYTIALFFFELCKATGKRKYLKKAKELWKALRKWEVEGNPNVGHLVRLCEAEIMSFSQQHPESVRIAYDTAISTSAMWGDVRNKARSNELACKYFLRQGDYPLAKDYLESALADYENWGAGAKVSWLRGKYTELLEGSVAPARSQK